MEGLKELARIKSSGFFAGKDSEIYIIQRYVKIYEEKLIRTKEDLSGLILCSDEVENCARRKAEALREEEALAALSKPSKVRTATMSADDATRAYLEKAEKDKYLMDELIRAAQDKASKLAIRLRKQLRVFYEMEEGKESAYRIGFVAGTGDYRLKVENVGAEEANENDAVMLLSPQSPGNGEVSQEEITEPEDHLINEISFDNNELDRVRRTLEELTFEGEKLLDGPYADDALEDTIQHIITEAFEKVRGSYALEDFEGADSFSNYIEELQCCRPEIEDAVLSYRQRNRYFQKISEWIICCREILKFAGLDSFLDDFNRELGDIKFPEEEQLARLIGIMGSAKKLYSFLKSD